MSHDLSRLDATAQADLVRKGETSPRELVDAAINRIEKVNPEINAVITPLFEKARAAAASRDLPKGPFQGVPFLLKDLGVWSAGDRYCAGMKLLRDLGWCEKEDSFLAARYRAAGFVFVGKANTPEFGSVTSDRARCIRSLTQPVGSRALHRRIERRVGRGGGFGDGPRRSCQ